MNIKPWIIASILLLGGGCSERAQITPPADNTQTKPHATSKLTHPITKLPEYLEQNWDHATRMTWWYTTQGARIMPYAWFLALELADSEQLFASHKHLSQLRFIAGPADPKLNPDALPIGFVADTDSNQERYIGVTCAACHTSKVSYQGKEYLIEGGPAHHDFDRFIHESAQALQATLANAAKFTRFAERVLGSSATSAQVNGLKTQLTKLSHDLNQRDQVNHIDKLNGFARLDAFGNIFNEVAVFAIGVPENKQPANAPVSFPVVWDTPQHDVVQWNASASNAGIGPYARNAGEVIGVFGDLRFHPGSKQPTQHIRVDNLQRLESILATLWSPLWPADFPAIDQLKARQGQAIYNTQCSSCHALIKRDDPHRHVQAKLVHIDSLGTDALTANNIQYRTSKTGLLQGLPTLQGPLPAEVPTAELVGIGVLAVLKETLPSILPAEELAAQTAAFLKDTAKPHCAPLKNSSGALIPCYKARPLNGVWASAPYLHNGSIPNLWELLQPPANRVQHFYVGSWEFDAQKVGFVSDASPNSTEFDTQKPGNYNTGHNYGTDLSAADKKALIEYLKTL